MGTELIYQGQDRTHALTQDYWKLLRLMIKDAVESNPNGAVLLRFDQFAQFTRNFSKEAAANLSGIVKAEAENFLSQEDMILAYDDMSYVLIANEKNHESSYALAQEICKSIGLHLMGSALGKSTITLCQITEVTENGISLEELENSNQQLEEEPEIEEREHQADLELIGQASFDFLPIWHVRRNIVMSFECIPRWHLDDGTILDEKDLSKRFQKHDMEYALDAETVHHAVDQTIDIIEHDAMASILVPVHYDTIMEEEGFEKFLLAYGELMPIWRERVSMEIKCIPDDISFDELKLAIHRIRPYCHGLYLQVPWDFKLFGDYGVDGLVSVGLDLTHEERDEHDVITDMEAFIAATMDYGNLHTHILGLKSVSLSVAAICAGFDFIGSQPIEKELEGWGIDDFLIKPIDLYKKFLQEKHS